MLIHLSNMSRKLSLTYKEFPTFSHSTFLSGMNPWLTISTLVHSEHLRGITTTKVDLNMHSHS